MDQSIKAALVTLRDAAHRVAAADTAYDEDQYNEARQCACTGHCELVAWVVQEAFGGWLIGGNFEGTRHVWNQLPSGAYVDLTKCQYDGLRRTLNFNPIAPGRKLPDRKTDNPRLVLFKARLQADLKRSKAS